MKKRKSRKIIAMAIYVSNTKENILDGKINSFQYFWLTFSFHLVRMAMTPLKSPFLKKL